MLADGGTAHGGRGRRGRGTAIGRAPFMGRGRGRGTRAMDEDGDFHMSATWRHNHFQRKEGEPLSIGNMELDLAERYPSSRKRLNFCGGSKCE